MNKNGLLNLVYDKDMKFKRKMLFVLILGTHGTNNITHFKDQ